MLLFLPGVLVRVAFCGRRSTALSRCQFWPTLLKGVTRSTRWSAQPRPLPVSRAARIPSTRSLSLCARVSTTSQQTCVTCLRADRWVCSTRAHAHTPASRDGARNQALPLILHSIPVVHMLQEVLAAAVTQAQELLSPIPPSSSRVSSSALTRVKHLPLKKSPRPYTLESSKPVKNMRPPICVMKKSKWSHNPGEDSPRSRPLHR